MSKFANSFLKSLNEGVKSGAKKKNDGNLANNAKPYDKVTRGDVIAGRLGKDEMGGKSIKKEGNDKLLLGNKVAEKKKTMKEALIQGVMSAEAENPAPAPEADDSEAWKKSLDKGTNPEDFDVADNPQHDVDVGGIKAAHEWIKKLVTMAEFVNGTGSESLNSQINQLELKNSVPFRGVVRREEKRITKLAENLRGLAEVLKSVVITSEKKVKDATSPR